MVSTLKKFLIKSFPILAALFTCVQIFVLSSAAVYASEVDPPSSEALPFELVTPEEYKDPVFNYLASDAGGSRAVYSVTDVYNLLAQQFGLSTDSVSSAYIWSRMAGYLKMLGLNINGSNSQYSMSLRDVIVQMFPVPAYNSTQYAFAYPTGSGTYLTSAEMQFVISNTLSRHFSGTNGNYIDAYLANIASYTNSIRTTLSNYLDDYNWVSLGTYNGTSLGFDTSFLSSQTNASNFKVSYTLNSNNTPCLYRVSLPIVRANANDNDISNYVISSIKTQSGSTYTDIDIPDYFVEIGIRNIYVYFFNFRPVGNQNYYISVTNSHGMTYYPTGVVGASYLPYDTDEFQQIAQAFYSSRSSSLLEQLVNVLADPAKQAAEDASQAVIDDTLDGFTGSGSAAAKVNDTTSMKNVSSGLRDGLSSGAGVSNAMSVFNTSSGFWGWFSQSNSNAINNPYPAPTVPNLRGDGDQIVDFLSNNDNQLQDILGGAEW